MKLRLITEACMEDIARNSIATPVYAGPTALCLWIHSNLNFI
jgi:hypothetical protein